MSRLDEDCSFGAHMLCDIADDLSKKYPDIELYIIGGGSEYQKISDKVKKVNKKHGRRLIFALGNLNDPSIYFDTQGVFVGVSRSALEAMAHGMPVILLGNEGYLGLLNKNNMQQAIKSNLTCRCSPKLPTPLELTRELTRFFELDDKEREHLSALSVSLVKKEFSADQMAKNTLVFYKQILLEYNKLHQNVRANRSREKKICLCGYYGRGNLGDEAILSQIKQKLSSSKYANAKISIIKSKNPLKIVSALKDAELFIFGGGSLLQNSTSNASLLFYIAIIFLADVLCQKKIMLSNGVGPIKTESIFECFLERSTKIVLKYFDLISVRDRDSQELLQKWLPQRKIRLIYDPALIFFCDNEKEIDQQSISLLSNDKKDIVFIPNIRALYECEISPKELASVISGICDNPNCSVNIVILNQKDLKETNTIANLLPNAHISMPTSPRELISLMSNAKICISQRYHGALYSAGCAVPTLAVSNDPKLVALCKEWDIVKSQPTNILKNEAKLKKLCISTIEQSQKNIKETKKIARKNAQKTSQLIEKVLERY